MLTQELRPPLALDCDKLGAGLPAGRVPLHVLRDWMARHPHAHRARNAVWWELIRRARQTGGDWLIAAVGMAMPALVGHAKHLAAGYQGDVRDLDNEVLAGFVTALRKRDDLDGPGPYAKLCWSAYRAGQAARIADSAHALIEDLDLLVGARSPRLPYGHPDLLVRRAVALGVIAADDAEAFIDVRLAHRDVEPLAADRGINPDTLRRRVERAAGRLAEAMVAGLLSGPASPEGSHDLDSRRDRGERIRAALHRRSATTDTHRDSAEAA
ncbi:MAG: hypothetical protein ACRDT2_16565 [Natronosporangium sp.]